MLNQSEANLSEANLSEANQSEANLSEAKLNVQHLLYFYSERKRVSQCSNEKKGIK
ncbi:MAG: pentapeptide repeat-containing protein [Bacillota bacterium]